MASPTRPAIDSASMAASFDENDPVYIVEQALQDRAMRWISRFGNAHCALRLDSWPARRRHPSMLTPLVRKVYEALPAGCIAVFAVPPVGVSRRSDRSPSRPAESPGGLPRRADRRPSAFDDRRA